MGFARLIDREDLCRAARPLPRTRVILGLLYTGSSLNPSSVLLADGSWPLRDGSAQPHRERRFQMKIVVIGGTGLIGSKLVTKLNQQGHEAVAASPSRGVNTITGEGVAAAMEGASIVVDVSNSPSFEYGAALEFFQTSTRNLQAAETATGVGHHVALSVVGTDRLSESGYFRAKIAQEKLIKESSRPYSIVHATQFFEFLKGLADISFDGDKVHLPPVLFQPMAADDVASGVGRIAVGL